MKHINEKIEIPVEIGDTIYTGKFKNKKTVVKSIGKDEKEQPIINNKTILKFKIPKKPNITFEQLNDLIKNTVSNIINENHKYSSGCLMTYIDINNWNDLLNNINKNDLYTEEDEEYGLEFNPHITILYGFELDKVNTSDIDNILKNIKQISVKTNGISLFENDKYDVLKIDIVSDDLNKLNRICLNHLNTNKYPTYEPHMNIAYLKKGMGKKYMKKIKLKNTEFISSKFVYSYSNDKGNQKYIINK